MVINPLKSPFETYRNLFTMGIAMSLFLAFVFHVGVVSRNDTGMSRLMLLMLIQLATPLIVFARGGFNFLAFVMLNHFIVYSVAKYNLLVNLDNASNISPQALLAIQEMTFCTFLIIISYYTIRYLLFRKGAESRKDFEYLHLTEREYTWIGAMVIIHPFVIDYLPTSAYTIHVLLRYLLLVLLFSAKTPTPMTERQVKVAIFLSIIFSFLKQASLSTLGGLASILFIVAFLQRTWQNFFYLLFVALVGICIQSVKSEFRYMIHIDENVPIALRAAVLSELLAWRFTGEKGKAPLPVEIQEEMQKTSGTTEGVADGLDEEEEADGPKVTGILAKGFARIGDDSLERVLAMTPRVVPYWEGETYEHIPYMFIPRMLWPEKPRRDIWNRFGRAYGFLPETDLDTSVGINFLGEGFMNFGFTGLYTVAWIFGMLVATMEFLSYHLLRRHVFFIFIIFLSPLLNYGLDLGTILNGMLMVGALSIFFRYRLVHFLQRDVYA